MNISPIELIPYDEYAIKVDNSLLFFDGGVDYQIVSVKSGLEWNEDTLSIVSPDEYIKLEGSYIVVPALNQYFHNIVDVYSKVVKLKLSGVDFKVLIYNAHGNTNHITIEILKYKMDYLIDMLEMLGVEYKFLSSEYKYVECDNYVIFQRKGYRQRFKKFQVDKEIHPESWLFDDSYEIQTNYNCNKSLRSVCSVYRASFYDESLSQDKRVYISRKDAHRRDLDQDDLEDYFEKIGYEVVQLKGMSFADQVNLFNSASMVAGLSGSGFTNVMFCHPGTKVLEILASPEFDPHEFREISKYTDLDYRAVEAFGSDGSEILASLLESKSQSVKDFLI